MSEYDDSYPTCLGTDAMFRVIADDLSPDEISHILEIKPSAVRSKGELRVPGKPKTTNRVNVWGFESTEAVQSKDTRRHIDWILDKLNGKESALEKLRALGARLDVCCSWESSGQGGPTLDPQQMERLSRLGLSVWWEVWFVGEEEPDNKSLNTDAHSVGAG